MAVYRCSKLRLAIHGDITNDSLKEFFAKTSEDAMSGVKSDEDHYVNQPAETSASITHSTELAAAQEACSGQCTLVIEDLLYDTVGGVQVPREIDLLKFGRIKRIVNRLRKDSNHEGPIVYGFKAFKPGKEGALTFT